MRDGRRATDHEDRAIRDGARGTDHEDRAIRDGARGTDHEDRAMRNGRRATDHEDRAIRDGARGTDHEERDTSDESGDETRGQGHEGGGARMSGKGDGCSVRTPAHPRTLPRLQVEAGSWCGVLGCESFKDPSIQAPVEIPKRV